MQFIRHLLNDAKHGALDALTRDEITELIDDAFQFMADRPPQVHKVPIRNVLATGSIQQKYLELTVIEIINDDMPFLVESLLGEVQAQGFQVRAVIHPVLLVARDNDRLVSINRVADDSVSAEPESFIQIHLAAVGTAGAAGLVARLAIILVEERWAVTDWKAMLARLEKAVAAHESFPPGVHTSQLNEAIAFLKWLLAGNFTFLGMRELTLVSGDSAQSLSVWNTDFYAFAIRLNLFSYRTLCAAACDSGL